MFDAQATAPPAKRHKVFDEIVVKEAPPQKPTECLKETTLDIIQLKYPQLLLILEQQPSDSISRRLVKLPAVRQLVDNPRRRIRSQRVSTEGAAKYTSLDLNAVLCQITGTEHSSPCGRCTQGLSPWDSCVKVPQGIANDPMEGACANCLLYVNSCVRCEQSGKSTRRSPSSHIIKP